MGMHRRKYKSYEDYEKNDPDHLLRILSDTVLSDLPQIEFEDGTTYTVANGWRRWANPRTGEHHNSTSTGSGRY
jgi:hypothetical protein